MYRKYQSPSQDWPVNMLFSCCYHWDSGLLADIRKTRAVRDEEMWWREERAPDWETLTQFYLVQDRPASTSQVATHQSQQTSQGPVQTFSFASWPGWAKHSSHHSAAWMSPGKLAAHTNLQQLGWRSQPTRNTSLFFYKNLFLGVEKKILNVSNFRRTKTGEDPKFFLFTILEFMYLVHTNSYADKDEDICYK